jgi:hypothetical protein
MTKRQPNIGSTGCYDGHETVHAQTAAIDGYVLMPIFSEDALQFLEERRRQLMRRRTMERIGGSSRFPQTIERATAL